MPLVGALWSSGTNSREEGGLNFQNAVLIFVYMKPFKEKIKMERKAQTQM